MIKKITIDLGAIIIRLLTDRLLCFVTLNGFSFPSVLPE